MKVAIYTLDGGGLEWADMDDASALDLRVEITEEDNEYLLFEMDNGDVIVRRDHIVRIEFGMEDDQ